MVESVADLKHPVAHTLVTAPRDSLVSTVKWCKWITPTLVTASPVRMVLVVWNQAPATSVCVDQDMLASTVVN